MANIDFRLGLRRPRLLDLGREKCLRRGAGRTNRGARLDANALANARRLHLSQFAFEGEGLRCLAVGQGALLARIAHGGCVRNLRVLLCRQSCGQFSNGRRRCVVLATESLKLGGRSRNAPLRPLGGNPRLVDLGRELAERGQTARVLLKPTDI